MRKTKAAEIEQMVCFGTYDEKILEHCERHCEVGAQKVCKARRDAKCQK